MRGFPTREQVERLRERYPSGTRVRLHSMEDPYAPVPYGAEGVIQAVDDAGQLLMRWDNGSSLSLIPGVDGFSVISRPKQAQEEAEQQTGGIEPCQTM